MTTGTSQVGTPHSLACHVGTSPTLPVGTVVFEWTSTCSGECFVLGQSATSIVSTQFLKAVDSGAHTCTITDSVGNIGNASVRISTTGKHKLFFVFIIGIHTYGAFWQELVFIIQVMDCSLITVWLWLPMAFFQGASFVFLGEERLELDVGLRPMETIILFQELMHLKSV